MRVTTLASTFSPTFALGFALVLWLLAPSSTASALAEECGAQACVSGASWSEGEQLDDGEREREAKRNRKRKDVTISVQVNGGRGSVFIDGVWIAPAPVSYVPIKPGKHDLEVRDGERVRARGVLTISTKGGDVGVRVY